MKKIVSFMLIFILIISFSGLECYAEYTKHTIAEANITISLPDSWIVFTSSTPANYISQYRIDGNAMSNNLKNSNSKLYAFNVYNNDVITATVNPDEMNDLSTYSDTEIHEFMEPTELFLASTLGFIITNSDIYQHKYMTFARFIGDYPMADLYDIMYYTVYNHQAIGFHYYSQGKEISINNALVFQKVIDSIEIIN